MQTLREKITKLSTEMPEGVPISAKELLHLGNRAAVDQALARLARRGTLSRIRRGEYVRPIATKFGQRAPSVSRVVEALARKRNETIARHGSAVANELGLTTQVPVRTIYLTSGRSATLKVGAETVELRHAPAWQLVRPGEPAGDALRAMTYLGPAHVRKVLARLNAKDVEKIMTWRSILPQEFAEQVSAHKAHGR